MILFKQTLYIFVVILLVIILFQYFQLDIYLQELFYSPFTGWWIDKSHRPLRFFCYYFPKLLLIVSAIFSCSFLFLTYFKFLTPNPKSQYNVIHFLLSLALVPACVSLLKHLTHISCPYDLHIFNGSEPYYHLLQRPLSSVAGQCFPAGHASGGLSLVSLFYIWNHKYFAFLICSLFSLIMGLYQTFNGAHFISHFIVSLLLAVWINQCIHYYLQSFYRGNNI